MPYTVLFIGGTGTISSACTQLAVDRGHNVTLLNRGKRTNPAGVAVIEADINDEAAVAKAIGDRTFDVVVNFIAYTRPQVERDIRLLAGRCGQYVFISSASAYQSPPSTPFITESTPLANRYWKYSRDKIDCEEALIEAYRRDGFPAVIVRPSHTYNDQSFPIALNGKHNWTVPQRMLDGLPIIVPGDGTSLWTATHSSDFAKGFVGLLGNPQTLGHAFHLMSEESLSWDAIHHAVAAALGVQAKLVHLPSDLLIAFNPDLSGPLLGDKSNSVIFDQSKLRRFVPDFAATVPFAEGARRVAAWYQADEKRRTVDADFNAWCDRVLDGYRKAWPGEVTF